MVSAIRYRLWISDSSWYAVALGPTIFSRLPVKAELGRKKEEKEKKKKKEKTR
jgi:hypothetical protein